METNKAGADDEIRLSDLLHTCIKHRKLILMTTVVGLVIGVILSIISYMRGEMSKQYEIKTSIAVTSQSQDGVFTTNTRNPNSSDIHLAEDMVDSVIFVLRSDRTIDAAVDKLELIGVSTKDVYDNMVLTQYKSTQIIDITLYWRNAEEGVKILETINAVSPGILIDVLKIGDVAVVNDPTARYLIGGSVKASTWLLATLVGMIVGMGISVLLLFVNPTLINTEDVGPILGMGLLGVIPEDRYYVKSRTDLMSKTAVNLGEGIHDNYISAAYNLLNQMKQHQYRVIFFTSSEKDEGKTSMAANLAIQLANLEHKVLMVDMDLVNPELGNLFIENLDYEHSLNAVYHGDTSIDMAIMPINGYLDLLPSYLGQKEILISEDMLKLVRSVTDRYDYVLIDAAAVGSSATVLSLKELADAAVMVVKYDSVSIRVLKKAKARIIDSGTPLLGCFVNRHGNI